MNKIKKRTISTLLCCLMGVTAFTVSGGGLIFAWDAETPSDNGAVEAAETAKAAQVTEEETTEAEQKAEAPQELQINKEAQSEAAALSSNIKKAKAAASVKADKLTTRAAASAHCCGDPPAMEGYFAGSLGCVPSTAQSYLHMCSANFPDGIFRNKMIGQVTTTTLPVMYPNKVLSTVNAANVTKINVDGGMNGEISTYITSTKGIEYFSNLETLRCGDNKLTKLDVSKNSKLTYLYIPRDQLTEIDVSRNPKLTDLNVGGNRLTEVDVSKNPALENLWCYNNQLTKIDVSNNPALTELGCYNNQLTKVDVSKNPNLTSWCCYSNQLTEVDVSNNPALAELDCVNNQLTELDLSKNPALWNLNVNANQLTELDLSNNPALRSLNVAVNQLTELDLSNNPKITNFKCANNQLLALSAPCSADDGARNQQRHIKAYGKADLNDYLEKTTLDGSKVSNIKGADINGSTISNYTDKNAQGEYVVTYEYDYSNGYVKMAVTVYVDVVPSDTKNITAKDTDGNLLESITTPKGSLAVGNIGDRKAVNVTDDMYIIEKNADGSYKVTTPAGKADNVTGNYEAPEVKDIAGKDADGNPLESITTPSGTLSVGAIGNSKSVKDGDDTYKIVKGADGNYSVTAPKGKTVNIHGNYAKPVPPTPGTGGGGSGGGSGTGGGSGSGGSGNTGGGSGSGGSGSGGGNSGGGSTTNGGNGGSYNTNGGNGSGSYNANGGNGSNTAASLNSLANSKDSKSLAKAGKDAKAKDIGTESGKNNIGTTEKSGYGGLLGLLGLEKGDFSITSMLLALVSIILAIGMFVKRITWSSYRSGFSMTLAAVIAVIGTGLFFTVNGLSSDIVLFEPTTAIFAGLTIVQIINMIIGKKEYEGVKQGNMQK